MVRAARISVQEETLFSYIEHMGLLNTHGEALARLVQQGLVRAGMKDVTVLSVQPSGGRRLVLRHGSALHRVQVLPVGRNPKTPDDEPGWLPLLVSSGFDDATLQATQKRLPLGSLFVFWRARPCRRA